MRLCRDVVQVVIEGEYVKYPESMLLVDDNELILYSMRRFFEKEFHHVVAVCTGEEAMLQVQHHFFHIVILDINLPGVDGWGVLEHINEHSPKSRVAIVTGCMDTDIRQKTLQRGASGYLEKPFEFDELRGIVTRLLAFFERERKMLKPVEVRFENKYRGLTYNLSATDMFVLTAVCFERGTTLNMTLHVPGGEPICLKGRVVTTTHSKCGLLPALSETGEVGAKYGVGLQVVEHSPAYCSFVNSFTGPVAGRA